MGTIRPILCSLLALAADRAAAQTSSPEPVKPEVKIEAREDYLAIHVQGRTNIATATWQQRLLTGAQPDAAWQSFPGPAADGTLQWELPVPEGGWERVEVRALDGEKVIARGGKTRPRKILQHLTPEAVAALPEEQRPAWRDYLARSEELARAERHALAAECRALGKPVSAPAPGVSDEFELPSKVEVDRFKTPESHRLAEVLLSYQTPSGAWSKGVDYGQGARPPGAHWTAQGDGGWHYCGTLDNRSTTEQIRFLAWTFAATGRQDCREGALRGMEWLLTAQFPNGGWPQVFPLEPGYHEAITLNDGAMLHALEILLAVSRGEEPFSFAEEALRFRAAGAVERGLRCLLSCQVIVAGARTVWCAQHHPLTLAPMAARLKEPPSLSGAESAEMLKFLMRQSPLTAEVKEAVESALAWLEAHAIRGLRKTKNVEGKTDYVEDADSGEVYWARFYDVETAAPMFAGARDGIVYRSFSEMAKRNKVGYDYFTTKPGDIVTKERERWNKRWAKEGR